MLSYNLPESLQEWTLEFIQDLIDKNIVEGEMLDFKLDLPDADTLTDLCCSFANSSGGYIIFGIKENKQFTIEGLPYNKEFARDFGDKLRATPPILYPGPKFIEINGSKFLIVFHIPKSSSAPHTHRDLQKMKFWKRTTKGKEQMTLEEVKEHFQRPLNKKIYDLTEMMQSIFLEEKKRRIRLKDYFITRIKSYYKRLIGAYHEFDIALEAWTSDQDNEERIRSLEQSARSLVFSIDAFWPIAEGDFKEIQEMVDNPRLKDKFVFIVGTALSIIKGHLSNKVGNSLSLYSVDHNREDIKMWMGSIEEFVTLLDKEVEESPQK